MLQKIPLIVITGFLGSGKTTLLNHLLKSLASQPASPRVAIIENEFAAAFGIENEILEHAHDNVASLDNLYEFGWGCVCCSSSGELLRTLWEIQERNGSESQKPIDYVILETTGLADPAGVLRALQKDEGIMDTFYISKIVSVLDCNYFLGQLLRNGGMVENALALAESDEFKNEVLSQTLTADIILLNKTDLVTQKHMKTLEGLVRVYNPRGKVLHSVYSRIPLVELLDRNPTILTPTIPATEIDLKSHDPNIKATIVFQSLPVDLNKTLSFITSFSKAHLGAVFRVKGVFYLTGEDEKVVIQGVGTDTGGLDVQIFRRKLDTEKDTERISRLTFIGKNLDKEELDIGFNKCVS